MNWRLSLDVPYSLPVELGYNIHRHASNFSPQADSFDNTWRDDKTGLVMLMPSFLKRDYFLNTVGLSSFRRNEDLWRNSKVSYDRADAFTNINAGVGDSASSIEIFVDSAIVVINELIAQSDTLKWALETNFMLHADESFGITIGPMSSEFMRKSNMLYIQWDNIGIHFSQSGFARVYLYNRSSMSSPPVLVHSFHYASTTDINNRINHFIFIPIPSYGILLLHSTRPPSVSLFQSSARMSSPRGELVRFPSHDTPGGYSEMFLSSPLRIAINPYQTYLIGVERIRYSQVGSYVDSAIDPGYVPSVHPSSLYPIFLQTRERSGTAVLRNSKNDGDWSSGVDRTGRVKVQMQSSDPVYTPFLFGYGISFDPVYNVRDTTPVLIGDSGHVDKIVRLEWTEDESGRFEGIAELKLQSPEAVGIANRGDSTFVLEYSPDNIEWFTLFGGFAKDFKNDVRMDFGGQWYSCTVSLLDFWERFREVQHRPGSSFDGMSIGEALDVIMRTCGFPPVHYRDSDSAHAADSVKIPRPPDGRTWRFGISDGQLYEEYVRNLLLFMRGQNVEYRLVYDWSFQSWFLERKPRVTSSVWSLSPFQSDRNSLSLTWYYGDDSSMSPEPPEANVVVVVGLTTPDAEGSQIMSVPLKNSASFYDSSHPDYLGRSVVRHFTVSPLSRFGDANRMARIIYDSIAHSRRRANITIPSAHLGITVNHAINLLDTNREVIYSGWVKRRTVIVNMSDMDEVMSLELDTVWEGGIQD